MNQYLTNVAPEVGSGFTFGDFLPIIGILIVGIIVFLFVRQYFFD